MKIIYKYHLAMKTSGTKFWALEIPRRAQILDIETQDSGFYLWALVDPDQPNEARMIHMTFTGNELPDTELPMDYLKTVHLPENGLVLHFFEEIG